MSVVRTHTGAGDFAVIAKSFLFDPKLSAKAKGILAYLFAHGDSWTAKQFDVENSMSDGRESVRSGFRELKEKGYLVVRKKHGKGGSWEWESTVYDVPQGKSTMCGKPADGKPVYGKPADGKPVYGKPADISNKSSSNKSSSNKNLNKKKKQNSSKSHSLASQKVQDLLKAYNDNRGTLPKALKLNKARIKKMEAFIKECETFEEALEYFRKASRFCAKDEFWLSRFYGLDNLLAESGSRIIQKAESYDATSKGKKVPSGGGESRERMVEDLIASYTPEDFALLYSMTPEEYRAKELGK